MAVPQLHRFHLLVPLAFAGDLGAVAEDAAFEFGADQSARAGTHGSAMLGCTAWHGGSLLIPLAPASMPRSRGRRQESDTSAMASVRKASPYGFYMAVF